MWLGGGGVKAQRSDSDSLWGTRLICLFPFLLWRHAEIFFQINQTHRSLVAELQSVNTPAPPTSTPTPIPIWFLELEHCCQSLFSIEITVCLSFLICLLLCWLFNSVSMLSSRLTADLIDFIRTAACLYCVVWITALMYDSSNMSQWIWCTVNCVHSHWLKI